MPRPKFRSKNEQEAYAVLKRLFPRTPIIHDYHVGEGLKIDFVIKTSVLVGVEVDGAQHYEYNSRWHSEKSDLADQQRRDRRKEELCLAQGISIVRYDARAGVDSMILRAQVMRALESAGKAPPREKSFSSKAKEQKEKQKQWRKKRYQELKQRKKEKKESK